MTAAHAYDTTDRLLAVTNAKGTTFSSFAYTLDAVGNRTQVVKNAGTESYGYDSLYRLTSVTYPDRPRTATATTRRATA